MVTPVWFLCSAFLVFLLQNVRCFDEPELFEEIRVDLIQILKEIDVFLKREENQELAKLRKIHRWRLFHRNKDALNRSIVDHVHMEYNKQLGIVCPKTMNVARKNQLRYEVESLTNVNFEVILNTLQRLQEFVNLTLQSTPAPRTRSTWMHPVFDDPQFQKDIIEQKKIDLLKYVDGRWKPKRKPLPSPPSGQRGRKGNLMRITITPKQK